jgi:hypothetical protein
MTPNWPKSPIFRNFYGFSSTSLFALFEIQRAIIEAKIKNPIIADEVFKAWCGAMTFLTVMNNRTSISDKIAKFCLPSRWWIF